MRLEWDEGKRRTNLIKHKVDFASLRSVFTDPRRVEGAGPAARLRRARIVLLCPVRGQLLHVTYTPRGDTYRIISARKANHRERRFHERYRADHAGGPDH